MRLGEIKQITDKAISDNKTIQIENEPLYEERVQRVNNYPTIIEALQLLASMAWSEVNLEELEELITKYPINSLPEMPLEDYNRFSGYIGKINEKLPIFYSILSQMVDPQDENIINIKLPEKINSLTELNEFNSRIATLFSCFQLDGEFEFCEFDKGTSWYEIAVTGLATYPYFIACLQIAQEYYKMRTEYFKSQKAKIGYELAKESQDNLTYDNYQQKWFKLYLRKEVSSIVDEKIKELNGETNESLQNKLVIATTKLVKELGEGTEFHLSLNPPAYAKEQAGQLIIDYKKISTERKKEITGPAQIEAPIETESEE